MEHEILESKKDKLILKFKPFDEGILNLVKQELWNDKATQMAGFKITHPEVGFAKFVLSTKGKAPKLVWNAALKRASAAIDSFGKEVAKLK